MNFVNLYVLLMALYPSITRAQNSAVKVNDSVQLSCNDTYTRGEYFSVQQDLPSKPDQKYTLQTFDNISYHHIESNSTHRVTILSVQQNQGGMYICVDNNQSVAVVAHIIVLDLNPICSVNLTSLIISMRESFTKMSCSVTYTGYWSPVIRWKRENESLFLINNSHSMDLTDTDSSGDIQYQITESKVQHNNSVTLISVLNVTRSTLIYSNQSSRNEQYQCVTFFTADNKPVNLTNEYAKSYKLVQTHDNIPGYHHVCNVSVTWPLDADLTQKDISTTEVHSSIQTSGSKASECNSTNLGTTTNILTSIQPVYGNGNTIINVIAGVLTLVVVVFTVSMLMMCLRQKQTIEVLADVKRQNEVLSTEVRSGPRNHFRPISAMFSRMMPHRTRLSHEDPEELYEDINARCNPSIPKSRNIAPQIISHQTRKPDLDNIEMQETNGACGLAEYSKVNKNKNAAHAKASHENQYASSTAPAAAVVYAQVNKNKKAEVTLKPPSSPEVVYSEVNKERSENQKLQKPKMNDKISSPSMNALSNPSYGAYSDLEEIGAEMKNAEPLDDIRDTYCDIDEVRTETKKPAPASSPMTSSTSPPAKQQCELTGTYSDIDDIVEDKRELNSSKRVSQNHPEGHHDILSYSDVDEINEDTEDGRLSPPEELYDTCSLLEKKRMAEAEEFSGGYDSIL